MSLAENLSPQVIANLARQIKLLATKPPDGIKLLPRSGTLTELHVLMTGPAQTPYEGGEFHVKLVLSKDYPASPPKGFFLTKIYHPNIAETGDICVNTLKRDWKPEYGFSHVLQVIRCLLIVPFPESSLNEEAGKLFMESYDEYAKYARLMTSIHAKSSEGAKEKDLSAVDSPMEGGGGGSSEPIKSTAAATKKKATKKKALKRL